MLGFSRLVVIACSVASVFSAATHAVRDDNSTSMEVDVLFNPTFPVPTLTQIRVRASLH